MSELTVPTAQTAQTALTTAAGVEKELAPEANDLTVYSFPPIINEQSRVLVLGSMPGVPSLTVNEYYGNPRNYMWRVLYGLHGLNTVDEAYEQRIAFALSHHIAMWDVLKSCTREGSLDAAIRDEVVNDVPALLEQYPNLRCIAFNGSKSHDTFMRHFGKLQSVQRIDCLKLPSTSPVPTKAMRTLADRLGAWQVIVPYLQ
nr:DNA-deoxyinosine glycosylase [Paenibacillus sp. MMS18-CY102]